MSAFCFLQPQIESLLMTDIVLYAPTYKDGQFIPGNSICEKTIRVGLTSGVAFPRGVILQLQLFSSIDESGVKTPIEPTICVSKTTQCNENQIWFDFVGAQIPLPKGYVYLSNIQKTCLPGTVHLEAGSTQKYCFLLSIKKCRTSPITCPAMPFVARVLSNANCDIKCERPDLVSEPDETHTLKIYCQDTKTFVYAAPIHCVTHCQAPRPIFLFYSENCPTSVVTQGQTCTTCQ